jgi:hypothetical protein
MPPGGMPMDPAMMGGMPPGGMPMDPSMMGGMPPGGMPPGGMPMDPAMMGGMPPAPPPPAPAPEPGKEISTEQVKKIVQEVLQSSGAGGKPKVPKVDLNIAIPKIMKLLALIVDHLGIHVPVSTMLAEDEPQENTQQENQPQEPNSPVGSITPIQPFNSQKTGMAINPLFLGLTNHYERDEPSDFLTKKAQMAHFLLSASREYRNG